MAVKAPAATATLLTATADLGSLRQSPGEFDDAVIQQGNACLECNRHAGSINLREDVVGEICDEVHQLHLLKKTRKSLLLAPDPKEFL